MGPELIQQRGFGALGLRSHDCRRRDNTWSRAEEHPSVKDQRTGVLHRPCGIHPLSCRSCISFTNLSLGRGLQTNKWGSTRTSVPREDINLRLGTPAERGVLSGGRNSPLGEIFGGRRRRGGPTGITGHISKQGRLHSGSHYHVHRTTTAGGRSIIFDFQSSTHDPIIHAKRVSKWGGGD
jgi:hypothetical protein